MLLEWCGVSLSDVHILADTEVSAQRGSIRGSVRVRCLRPKVVAGGDPRPGFGAYSMECDNSATGGEMIALRVLGRHFCLVKE